MSKLYRCTVCKKKKQLDEFYLRSTGTVGEYKCKVCLVNKRAKHYYGNYEESREINRKAVSEFQKRNRHLTYEKTARYKAKKKDAVPSWLSKEDISKIKSVYKMCRVISKKTGIRHEVDHVVPINSNIVCGLHVPWNLQIVTSEYNKIKSNSLIEDIVCTTKRLVEEKEILT